MRSLTPELSAAIRNLYKVFSPYRHPKPVHGYPELAHPDVLCSKRLQELSAADLCEYANRALTTVGTLEDFKRFLPRLMELVALLGYIPGLDRQIVLGKISDAKLDPGNNYNRLKNEEETIAIERFLVEWWKFELQLPPEEIGWRDEIMESIGCAVMDIQPYLEIWRQTDTLHATIRLASLIVSQEKSLGNPPYRLDMCYWGKQTHTQQYQLLYEFIFHPDTAELLERWYFSASDHPQAKMLADANELLKWVSKVSHKREES